MVEVVTGTMEATIDTASPNTARPTTRAVVAMVMIAVRLEGLAGVNGAQGTATLRVWKSACGKICIYIIYSQTADSLIISSSHVA